MKKAQIIISSLLFLAVLLSAEDQSRKYSRESLSLRFYGGLSTLQPGDLNRGLAGWLDLWNHTAELYGLPGGAGFDGARWGIEAGADLLIPLGPRLSLGLGAGSISASASSQSHFPSNDVVPSSHKIKVRPWAVPLRAGLHCLLPLTDCLEIRLQAGAVYYLVRAEAEYTRDWNGYWEKDRYKLKSAGLGYQGGIGFELRLNRWAAVFLEGQARLARISNFSGSLERISSEGGSILQEGTLYLIDYKLAEGAVFSVIDVLDEQPSGPAFLNVRKAVVDFSGFALNMGLTLRF
jgi:hypothetical protein